jgi:ATP phosphoribosyltransferase regulatory subunit HisZ
MCKAVLLASVCAVLLGAAGCQRPLADNADLASLPRESSAELVAHIADQPFVSAEAAYRAAYALATGASHAGSYDEVVAENVAADVAPGHWSHEPGEALTRAEVAVLLCNAAGIRTGVNWNLTRLGRYAWRELMYHRIVAPGSEYNFMSGGEFVGALSRAGDYAARRDDDQPQLEQPGP